MALAMDFDVRSNIEKDISFSSNSIPKGTKDNFIITNIFSIFIYGR